MVSKKILMMGLGLLIGSLVFLVLVKSNFEFGKNTAEEAETCSIEPTEESNCE